MGDRKNRQGAAATLECPPGEALGISAEGFAKIPEAQAFLGLSRASVYSLMDSGELPYAKFGRSRRIPRRALREYADRNLVVR